MAPQPKNRDEHVVRDRFRQEYAQRSGHVYRLMEQAVIGADWGANGYTTVEEADELGRLLMLRDGMRLLDVGCGTGWPGLYLSAQTGCDVVGTDLPIEGLLAGRRRAGRKEVAGRLAFAVASAAGLPFRKQSFDAIVHTDVLC